MKSASRTGLYKLGDWSLSDGGILRGARLGYRVWGTPNADQDNFIVLPTYYSGTHDGYAPLIGADQVFDSDRFCVVALDLFGNGVSTSPSNAHLQQRGAAFPRISIGDAVAAQHRFLTEAMGMRSVALAAGWSMGGMQSYRWAADYPAQVRRILPWCAAARCSAHNGVFLDGLAAAMAADDKYPGDGTMAPPRDGLKAFARVYCGWAHSAAFFRSHGWRTMGYHSLGELLLAWEEDHLQWNAHDLISKLNTWRYNDFGSRDEAQFTARLATIPARAILMPCATDMYFPPEDNALEVAHIPHAEMRVVDHDWGHVAGGPGRQPAFTRALATAVSELLADYYPGEAMGRG